MTELPEYERPPVVEIIAGVQFVAVPQFAMREALAVSRRFADWEVVDVAPALEPIVEATAGHLVSPTLRFGLGTPPLRVILEQEHERWLAQVQQDRTVVHERKRDDRPSFSHVAPRLREVGHLASEALSRPLLEPPHLAELVEVIYENDLPAGTGWTEFSDLHRVLRMVNTKAGSAPFQRIEQAQVAFAYALTDGDEFAGRLRVVAEPQTSPEGGPSIHLRLISRRIVNNRDLDLVLEECHADIVRGFTAVTTEHMHELWGRTR